MKPCEHVKPWPLDDTIIKAYHLMATGQTVDAMEVLKPLFQDALYRKDLAALNQTDMLEVHYGDRIVQRIPLKPDPPLMTWQEFEQIENGADSARFSEASETNLLNFVRSSEFAQGVMHPRIPFKSEYLGIKRKEFKKLADEFMKANGLKTISALASYLNMSVGCLNHLMFGPNHGISKSRWALYLSQHLSPDILADQPKGSINEAS